jgi:hypothetical protein
MIAAFYERIVDFMNFERVLTLLTLENILILAAPLLIIVYRVIKQLGVWDKLVGRDKALEGLKRLRSTAGYPVSFIYDKQQDIKVFKALFQRMRKHCKELQLSRDVLASEFRPYLIATAGDPIEIKGLPPDWAQEARFFYPDNQPVLIVFKAPENLDRNDKQNDKGDKVCTLGEINTWLSEEKDRLDCFIGDCQVKCVKSRS